MERRLTNTLIGSFLRSMTSHSAYIFSNSRALPNSRSSRADQNRCIFRTERFSRCFAQNSESLGLSNCRHLSSFRREFRIVRRTSNSLIVIIRISLLGVVSFARFFFFGNSSSFRSDSAISISHLILVARMISAMSRANVTNEHTHRVINTSEPLILFAKVTIIIE